MYFSPTSSRSCQVPYMVWQDRPLHANLIMGGLQGGSAVAPVGSQLLPGCSHPPPSLPASPWCPHSLSGQGHLAAPNLCSWVSTALTSPTWDAFSDSLLTNSASPTRAFMWHTMHSESNMNNSVVVIRHVCVSCKRIFWKLFMTIFSEQSIFHTKND